MDIHVTFPLNKRVDATFDGHVVHTDQPRALGGDDSAPSPFDLFLASLATCAGAYIVSFCDRRGISLDGVELIQRAVYGDDGKTLIDVELDVHLPDDFPENYRAAVIRAAEGCRVKKVLANPPRVAVNAILEPPTSIEICA